MMAVCVFVALSALLFIGKIVRMKLTFLQRLYLPSSVVGGLVGLVIVSAFGQYIPAEGIADAQKVQGLPGDTGDRQRPHAAAGTFQVFSFSRHASHRQSSSLARRGSPQHRQLAPRG